MTESSISDYLSGIPAELQDPVVRAWTDFRQCADVKRISLPGDPLILETLGKVWASSRFVADSCVLDPAMLAGLLESGDLAGELSQRAGGLHFDAGTLESEGELMRALRQFRRREMVRIAWRDIAGWADLQETLSDLSTLAECCIRQAHDFLYRQACDRRGTPLLRSGRPQRLVILAMGKLGAWELNYSSDVDLIFAYPEEGILADKKETSHAEFFTRLCRGLIKVLDDVTSDGFVFRVDTRLRPFGESGPLAMSFEGMESYYQSQAREWERYAMIKARPVAGDFEAGEELLKMLRPFVYRRYLDYGAFSELRSMKLKITQELQRRDRMDNIKLGPGGIREIEFIGQAFQLIRGGREKSLRDRRILTVLKALADLSVMPGAVIEKLIDGYLFLRRVENRLQQYADQQTHDLPADPAGRLRLAFSLGFPEWEAFKRRLDDLRDDVHEVFEQVFVSPPSGGNSDAEAVWIGRGEPLELFAILGEMGYRQPRETFDIIDRFRHSPALRRLAAKGAESLDRLMPMLLEAAAKSKNPAAALKRILDLFEAIAGRNVYITMLLENPLALSQLVKLASASPWITSYLARYPILLDALLDSRTLYAPITRAELESQLDHQLESVEEDNLEEQMSVLRHFKQANVLRVAAADIMDVMPLMAVSDSLTEIAEVILGRVLAMAWRLVGLKHGVPPGARPDEVSGFCIVGFGKLGGIELGYGSDLDLVFLYECEEAGALTQGKRPIPSSQFYARLGQRIISILNTNMHSGVLYDVDMRLRPSGNSGLLVSPVDAYEIYQETQAWTWEHQALVRARFVTGDLRIKARLEQIRRKILCKPRDPEKLKQEVKEMREKMRASQGPAQSDLFDLKQSVGGIADIEFIVQYGVLAHASEDDRLIEFTDNVRQLKALAKAGFLSADEAESLKQAYCDYRDLGHRETLQQKPAVVPVDAFTAHRSRVEEIWSRLMN